MNPITAPAALSAHGFTIYAENDRPVAMVLSTYLSDTLTDDNYRELCERSGQGEQDAYALARTLALAPELADALRDTLTWWHSDARHMASVEPSWLPTVRALLAKLDGAA